MRSSGNGWTGRVKAVLLSVLRCDPQIRRWLPAALLVISAGLTIWIFELGAILQGQAEVRDWSSVWVGLDILEVVGLVATALLLRRRSIYLPAVAAATATLFVLDAWFDVLTAAAGSDVMQAYAAAAFGEVPLAIVLAAISAWAVRVNHDDLQRCDSRQRRDEVPSAG